MIPRTTTARREVRRQVLSDTRGRTARSMSQPITLAGASRALSALDNRAETRAPMNSTRAAAGRYRWAISIITRSGSARSGMSTAPAMPRSTGSSPTVR